MKLWSVYVGKYKNQSESKKDDNKLLKLGYKGYLFCKGNYYTLKVFTLTSEDKAFYANLMLKKLGFDSYVE